MKVNAVFTTSIFAVVEVATCSLSLFGTITMGGTAPTSYAPLSQKLRSPKSGRGKSRWSVPNAVPVWSLQLMTGIRPIAGLMDGKVSSANVSVGPPLFANGNKRGLILSLAPASKLQLPSSEMLNPRSVGAVLSQFMLVLLDQIVPLREGPGASKYPPPASAVFPVI